MSDTRENLLRRREILSAYVAVLEQPVKLMEVCAAATGDDDAVRAAVEDAFSLSLFGAQAVLDLQVRRFTPAGLVQVRLELAELDRQFAETPDS